MDTINKYEILTAIAILCDELEDARRELRIVNSRIENNTIGGADLYCLEAGRRAVFEECTYRWVSLGGVARNEDGSIRCEPFEKWREHVTSRIPDTFSMAMFFEYFDSLYRERYEKEREMAVEALEALETEEE